MTKRISARAPRSLAAQLALRAALSLPSPEQYVADLAARRAQAAKDARERARAVKAFAVAMSGGAL